MTKRMRLVVSNDAALCRMPGIRSVASCYATLGKSNTSSDMTIRSTGKKFVDSPAEDLPANCPSVTTSVSSNGSRLSCRYSQSCSQSARISSLGWFSEPRLILQWAGDALPRINAATLDKRSGVSRAGIGISDAVLSGPAIARLVIRAIANARIATKLLRWCRLSRGRNLLIRNRPVVFKRSLSDGQFHRLLSRIGSKR